MPLADTTSRPVYRTWVGYDPPNVAPCDHATAGRRYRELLDALQRRDLTPKERKKLWTHMARWKARTEGKDPRFEVVGTRPGRLSAEDEGRVQEYRAHRAVVDLPRLARTSPLSSRGRRR